MVIVSYSSVHLHKLFSQSIGNTKEKEQSTVKSNKRVGTHCMYLLHFHAAQQYFPFPYFVCVMGMQGRDGTCMWS